MIHVLVGILKRLNPNNCYLYLIHLRYFWTNSQDRSPQRILYLLSEYWATKSINIIKKGDLVKRSSTCRCTTKTSDFFIFYWEFVIVCYLLVNSDCLFGIYHYFLLRFNSYNLRIAIWLKNEQMFSKLILCKINNDISDFTWIFYSKTLY